MLKVEDNLIEEGYNFTFVSVAVDGVSVDSDFVRKTLLAFLHGRRTMCPP